MLLQKITRKSLSSSVFMGFIAMALSCLVNNLFFNENLGVIKTICICGFGILGLIFLHFGDGKRLSRRGTIFFFVTAIIFSFSSFCVSGFGSVLLSICSARNIIFDKTAVRKIENIISSKGYIYSLFFKPQKNNPGNKSGG